MDIDLKNAAMDDLRKASERVCIEIGDLEKAVETAEVDLENAKYRHLQICNELLRRTPR